MRTGTWTPSLSRRQLLATGAFGALASFIRTSSASGQQLATDEIVPTKWALVQNGTAIARFGALDALEQKQQVPSKTALELTPPDSPLPGKRRPPVLLLRGSTNVAALQKWFEQVLAFGTASALKTLYLVALDAENKRIKRYLVSNAFPADLTMRGKDKSLTSSSVALMKLVCGRVDTVNDPMLPDDWKPGPGPRCALEIDGEEVASFGKITGVSSEVDSDDLIESDKDDDLKWKLAAAEKKPVLLKFAAGRDFANFFWLWNKRARRNAIDTVRQSGVLVLYGADQTVTAKYGFEQAWPCDYDLSPRVTKYEHTLYKSLTIACDRLEAGA